MSRSTSKATTLYLIEILHQTTTLVTLVLPLLGCILSKFYIKPQQAGGDKHRTQSCILSKFYIKPQPPLLNSRRPPRCILSKFYIKPQQCPDCLISFEVVSYRNSTSNHNNPRYLPNKKKLYLIEILHQTTTIMSRFSSIRRCILSKFYIKPQPCGRPNLCTPSCILSKFYIKPQLTGRTLNGFDGCILSKFYIKPQPVGPGKTVKLCCILSKFYIKPQHSYQCPFLFVVVSYRNSTSNHNYAS